jgi:hypothetical protein
MSITIIVKDGKPSGKTRSVIDHELRDNGWGSTFKNEGDRDKCEFIERKLKKDLGVDDAQIPASVINRIGK